MNCEHVFQVLTRGPFPTGDHEDVDVERHLACCHDCRVLAEALRPAVGLFHEVLDDEQQRGLPGYRGSAGGSAAVMTRTRTRLSPPTVRRERRGSMVWWLAAAMLAGLLLTVLAGAGGSWWQGEPEGARVVQFPEFDGFTGPLSEADRRLLEDLPISPGCRPHEGADVSVYLCCTRCHASAVPGPKPPAHAVGEVVLACHVCHQ